MSKIASDDWLVYFRFGSAKIPIRTQAVEAHIAKLLQEQFERFHLPTIPIALFSDPPENLFYSYGWYTSERDTSSPKRVPVALCYNVRLWDGLTYSEMVDIVLHEFSHFLVNSRGMDEPHNGGHNKAFFDTCVEVGCKPEASSSHRMLHVKDHLLKDELTEAKRLFLQGEIEEALTIAREESLYNRENTAKSILFEAFMNFYTENLSCLLVCLEELKEYLDDPYVEGAWACLSLCNVRRGDEWPYVMHLRNSARRGCTLARYFYAKILLDGSYGLSPSLEEGVRYLEAAAEKHFAPAMALYMRVLQENFPDRPDLSGISELITLDIGENILLDIHPGEPGCECYIPSF